MDYIWKFKDKEFKLRLTVGAIVRLEKAIKRNPLELFGKDGSELPATEELAYVIYCAIQKSYACTMDVVYALIDEWLDDGHKYEELFTMITEIYYCSGLIERPEPEKQEKNAKKARA